MKKSKLHGVFSALLSFVALTLVNSVDASAQTEDANYVLSTGKEFGTEMTFYPLPVEGHSEIVVDWGDGEKVKYTIKPDAYLYDRKVSGAVKGSQIRVYAQLQELDLSGQGITAIKVRNQEALKQLFLNENELTTDQLQISEAHHLEHLDVRKNKLTLLDLSPFSHLTILTASENESLGGVLLSPQVDALQSIDLSKCDISHFGPYRLPALHDLNLSYNALADLDLLDNYPALKDLNIEHNYIASLDLDGVPSIERLILNANLLTSIDLTNLSKLRDLFIAENKLTVLNLSSSSQLMNIDCSSNEITALNLSSLGLLQRLNCSKNRIAVLDIRQSTYLKRLQAADNKLAVLNLSKNNHLAYLDLRNNTNFTPCSASYMFTTMWAAPRKTLSANLLLSGCHVETADHSSIEDKEYNWTPDITFVETPTPCDSLSVTITCDAQKGRATFTQHNPHKDLYVEVGQKVFSGAPIYVEVHPEAGYHFAGLRLNDQVITETPFIVSNDATIEVLFEEDNEVILTVDEGQDLSLAVAPVSGDGYAINWGDGTFVPYTSEAGKLTRIEGKALSNKVEIKGDFVKIDFESYPGMDTWDNHIKGVQLLAQHRLEELGLYMNPLGAVDLSHCEALRVLNIAYCELTALDLSACRQLEVLEAYGNNHLQAIDLSANTLLKSIDLKNCALTHIDLSNHAELEKLDVQNNRLSDVALDALPKLTQLRLSGNALTRVDLSKLPSLVILAANNNKLTASDLTHNEKLEQLYLENNVVRSIHFPAHSRMTYINVAQNGMDACQLNDLYNALPLRSTEGTLPVADNVSLRVSAVAGDNANRAETADGRIATFKGWSMDEAGDGSGCDMAYIYLLPAEHGSYTVCDQQKKNVISGTKVSKSETLTIVPTPEDGYEVEGVSINSTMQKALQFTPLKASWIKVRFKNATATEVPASDAFFHLSGMRLTLSAEVSEAWIYDATGQLIVHLDRGASFDTTALQKGVYILQIKGEERSYQFKITL